MSRGHTLSLKHIYERRGFQNRDLFSGTPCTRWHFYVGGMQQSQCLTPIVFMLCPFINVDYFFRVNVCIYSVNIHWKYDADRLYLVKAILVFLYDGSVLVQRVWLAPAVHTQNEQKWYIANKFHARRQQHTDTLIHGTAPWACDVIWPRRLIPELHIGSVLNLDSFL